MSRVLIFLPLIFHGKVCFLGRNLMIGVLPPTNQEIGGTEAALSTEWQAKFRVSPPPNESRSNSYATYFFMLTGK